MQKGKFDLFRVKGLVDQACVGWWLSVSKAGFIRKGRPFTP